MTARPIRAAVLSAAFVAILPGLFGCPVIVRNDKGVTYHCEEPVSGQPYELYIPSTYTPDHAWPLIVTCHGTPPFDTAKLQVREWTDLAERRGLIIAAPILKGTHACSDAKPATVEKQVRLQQYDEQTILATINHVRAGYHIDEGKVFLTGWSAGNYAVLWTGLSHPEVFRALALRQGNFEPKFVAPLKSRLSDQQQVMVFYGQIDLLRPQAENCIRWLKEQGVTVFSDQIYGAHHRVPDLAYRYFDGVSRGSPWFVVRYEPGWAGDPLTVRLRAKTDPATENVEWSLGDGKMVRGRSVTYTYARGGTYDVTVRADFGKKATLERRLSVVVAPASVRAASASQPVRN
jgi:poly(3-hydroxybutyrate) depolymerase